MTDRLQSLQSRLRKTAEDVSRGVGDTKQKQRMLDIADRVKEAAADKTTFGSGEKDTEVSDAQRDVDFAVQSWVIGTTLLGAGAEHLTAATKQRLAKALVELAAAIIHHWTSAHLEADFADVKAELTTDEVIKAVVGDVAGQGEIDETRRYIAGIVDVLEFAFLSEPLRRILHHLCEGARQKVLGTSVEKAEVSGVMELLVHGAWLADIEVARGASALNGAIKGLPATPFLRSALANHFLARVYWSHWKKEDRLALLDAAEEALRPFDVNLNKAELKRLIEQSSRKDEGEASAPE